MKNNTNTKTNTKKEANTKKETKTKELQTYLVWVRNKETRQLETIEQQGTNVADVAKTVRASGKYSFKAAGKNKEELQAAMNKWEENNRKSIEYHKKNDNKEKFEKIQKGMDIIQKKLTKKEFDEVCELLNLNKYRG